MKFSRVRTVTAIRRPYRTRSAEWWLACLYRLAVRLQMLLGRSRVACTFLREDVVEPLE
jgi:hypothetical protein